MRSFRHSGKLGDIIYSLPAVRALGGGSYFVDHRTEYFQKPPLGEASAEMMTQLLRTQSYIHDAALYDGRLVTCDLDRFRDKAGGIHVFNFLRAQGNRFAGLLFGNAVEQMRENIIPKIEVDLPQCHWDCVSLPGKANLEPWLSGISPKHIGDIVVCKTDRYPGQLDWRMLAPFARKTVFVGLELEHFAFCESRFPVEFYKATDFVDLAQVIAAAKLFVANQGFGLALAEAMSVPRVVEVFDESPNRILSTNAHDSLTREIIEMHVSP